MPAMTRSAPDFAPRETTTETTIRLALGPTAPWLSRQHVRVAIPAHVSAGRICDLVLLTSELVTNAVEYSRTGPIDLTVVIGAMFTRVEVSNPNESWARAPEPRVSEPDQRDGWGLFLVEQLSDRWGTSDANCTVWFEFDHPASPLRDVWAVLQLVSYPASRQELITAALAARALPSVVTRLEAIESEQFEHAEAVAQELVDRRGESNPGLVAITAEVCERCGFLRAPGEPHSCIEQQALFTESANAVTRTFDRFDESTARQALSDDLRSGGDRRNVSMDVDRADERRHPTRRGGRRDDAG